MIHYIGANVLHPEPVVDDEEHYGPATSKYASAFTSSDQAVVVGVWEFEGEQFTRPGLGQEEGYEEILVLTHGTLKVECDGGMYDLEAGDVIVYDCPVGAKHLSSPNGFKGIFVVRYREPRVPAPS